jgi:hypothetical protein
MDPPAGYSAGNLVWDDTFQGTTLDNTHWSDVVGGPVPIPQWGNCCGTPIVNNGLTLTNTTNPRSNVDTSNPATGKVLFHFPTGGFFVQFRFKVTDMSHGFWPAVWFPYDDWTTQSNEPKNGNEIDMFEGGMLGGACTQADINSCVEFNYGGAPSEAAAGGWDQGFYNVGYDITQNFVTMGVEFIPGQHAKFYVNGKLVLDDELGADMAAQPNYNLQITPQGSPGTTGWHTNGPGTGSMYISEVQVYSLP